MSLLDKYDIIEEFFGLSAISIKNISGTRRERDLKTSEILEGYHILEPNNCSKRTLTALWKQIEQQYKDDELVPELKKNLE